MEQPAAGRHKLITGCREIPAKSGGNQGCCFILERAISWRQQNMVGHLVVKLLLTGRDCMHLNPGSLTSYMTLGKPHDPFPIQKRD